MKHFLIFFQLTDSGAAQFYSSFNSCSLRENINKQFPLFKLSIIAAVDKFTDLKLPNATIQSVLPTNEISKSFVL